MKIPKMELQLCLGYIVVKFYFLFLKVTKFDINVWTTVNTFEECQDSKYRNSVKLQHFN